MQILSEACSWNHYITFLILMISIINFLGEGKLKFFIKALGGGGKEQCTGC